MKTTPFTLSTAVGKAKTIAGSLPTTVDRAKTTVFMQSTRIDRIKTIVFKQSTRVGTSLQGLTKKQKKGSCHCGLDPQSPDKQASFFMRLRVKPAMTDFLVSPG